MRVGEHSRIQTRRAAHLAEKRAISTRHGYFSRSSLTPCVVLLAEFIAHAPTAAVGGQVKLRRVCVVERVLLESESGMDHGPGFEVAISDLKDYWSVL